MTYISYVPRICLQVTKNKGSSVLFFVQADLYKKTGQIRSQSKLGVMKK